GRAYILAFRFALRHMLIQESSRAADTVMFIAPRAGCRQIFRRMAERHDGRLETWPRDASFLRSAGRPAVAAPAQTPAHIPHDRAPRSLPFDPRSGLSA